VLALAETESGKPAKKGHGFGSGIRRLEGLPSWPDIELRLRHRWPPERVIDWVKTAHPTVQVPSRMSLYRYIAGKPPGWFVSELMLAQSGRTSVERHLVLKRQADLIETQILRVSTALALESQLGGVLIPEVRANMELLDRMLEKHLKTQQELGIEPKLTRDDPALPQQSPPSGWDQAAIDSMSVVEIHEVRRTLARLRGAPMPGLSQDRNMVIDGEAKRIDDVRPESGPEPRRRSATNTESGLEPPAEP
jgi:hypothetical protein